MDIEGRSNTSSKVIFSLRKKFFRGFRWDALMQWLASLYATPIPTRVAIGAVSALCGALWRLALMDVLQERVAYLTFYPVVAIAALFGGLVSGASAAVISALLTHLWFIPLSAAGDWLGLVTFLASCGIMAGIAEILHRTWLRMAEAETQRAHAERLYVIRKERLIAMGGMAVTLAHELNQPLTATAIYLKTARRLAKLPPNKRPASLEDTLVKGADQIMRAGQIISHMRQFVGSGEPDKMLCSLHELIREALELTLGALKETNVAVTLKLEGEKDTILADRVQIEQVLVNLIRNAREAMSASPRRELIISTSNEQLMIRLSIADTGPGLSKKMQKKLFEPFATTKGSGMGVGLSVSQAIVEAHYGRIWGESNPGGGAVFSFVLPLAEGDDR